MDIAIGFLVGGVIGMAGCFLVARNNKKRFTDALNMDPSAKWKEILDKLREKL